jgi:hypothetical protein
VIGVGGQPPIEPPRSEPEKPGGHWFWGKIVTLILVAAALLEIIGHLWPTNPDKDKLPTPRPASVEAKSQPTTSAHNMAPENSNQTFNVTSNNQQGGITAGVVHIQPTVGMPRWGLTEGQLTTLANRMRPFGGPIDRGDLITCVLGDRDSTLFAQSLVAAFRGAGWTLSGSGYNQAVYSGLPQGVILKLRTQTSSPPGLQALVMTLRDSGIVPTGELDPNLADDRFQIIVGSRP